MELLENGRERESQHKRGKKKRNPVTRLLCLGLIGAVHTHTQRRANNAQARPRLCIAPLSNSRPTAVVLCCTLGLISFFLNESWFFAPLKYCNTQLDRCQPTPQKIVPPRCFDKGEEGGFLFAEPLALGRWWFGALLLLLLLLPSQRAFRLDPAARAPPSAAASPVRKLGQDPEQPLCSAQIRLWLPA